MRSERKAEQELKSQGWLVYRVKGSTKFNKNVDIFGLWDILAIKKISPNLSRTSETAIVLIQVKTNKKPTLKPFKAFAQKYPDIECMIWIYKDRKEKEVIIL